MIFFKIKMCLEKICLKTIFRKQKYKNNGKNNNTKNTNIVFEWIKKMFVGGGFLRVATCISLEV